MDLTQETVRSAAKGWAEGRDAELVARIKPISMLHHETLALIKLFAEHAGSQGADVLEVGPYIGGSTIAIAAGLRAAGAGRVFAFEAGGNYDHPSIPSQDIVGDLRKNLAAEGLDDLVEVFVGYSQQPAARRAIRRLERHSVGLLVVDANGFPSWDVWMNESRLRDGCLLVFDDFESEKAIKKQITVRPFVLRAIDRGMFEDLGVFPWGTWFGRYHRPSLWKRITAQFADAPETVPVIGKFRSPRQAIRIWRRNRSAKPSR